MAAKNGRKTIFEKSRQQNLHIPWGYKNFVKISLSRNISEIKAFCVLRKKSKMATKKRRENDFWEKSPVDSLDTLRVKNFIDFWEKSPVDPADTLWLKNFIEITLSCTVSEINAFLHFTQKFKMAAKNDGKTIFGKSHQ